MNIAKWETSGIALFIRLNGCVSRRPSYGVYIYQLISFARVCRHVEDFNARNKCLTAKLFKQGYRYHKLRKTFSKFYRRHYELISKFNIGLKYFLHQGLSEFEFYGDLVYKFKQKLGRTDFSDQFRKIIVRHKRIGYNLNVMRQSTCLVINPITIDNFCCTLLLHAGGSGVTLYGGPSLKLFILVGRDRSFSSVASSIGAQLIIFVCFRFPVVLFDRPGISICHQHVVSLSPGLCFFIELRRDLYVYNYDSLTNRSNT